MRILGIWRIGVVVLWGKQSERPTYGASVVSDRGVSAMKVSIFLKRKHIKVHIYIYIFIYLW